MLKAWEKQVYQLLFSTNRVELKDKLEITIFNSEINNIRENSKLTWKFQKLQIHLIIIFNTEIFIKKEKYSHNIQIVKSISMII